MSNHLSLLRRPLPAVSHANQPQVPHNHQAGDAQPSLAAAVIPGLEYQGSPYGDTPMPSSDADASLSEIPFPLMARMSARRAQGGGSSCTLVGLLVGIVLYFFDFDCSILHGTDRYGPSSSAPSLVFTSHDSPLCLFTTQLLLTTSARGHDEKGNNNAQLGYGRRPLASDSRFTRCQTAFPRCLTS